MTIPEQAVEAAAVQFIENVCLDVAELPDRTSPDDRPEMMLVSVEELESCLRAHLPIFTAALPALMGVMRREDVARIIDPHAFKSWQSMYDYSIKHSGDNDAEARRCADYWHKAAIDEALAKADRVLALPHTGQPVEGALRKLEAQYAEDVAELEEIKSRGDLTKDYGEQSLYHARRGLERVRAAALSAAPASPQKREGEWRPIETAPNDSDFRWYGLHVKHNAGHEWFEAHYVAHDDDGQMILPSGDNFDDWAFSDFEFWCDAPPLPAPPVIAEQRENQ